MHPVIYDVAVSVDGYIAGPNEDISKFAHQGPVVDDYIARLGTYAHAIMGRRTYEFGYRFGLEPGQNPYAHMSTIVFSSTLAVPDDARITVMRDPPMDTIQQLRTHGNGPIYLCGGGTFAASLLAIGSIDRLRLKRAPVMLAGGTPLFERLPTNIQLELVDQKTYPGGYLFQDFRVAT